MNVSQKNSEYFFTHYAKELSTVTIKLILDAFNIADAKVNQEQASELNKLVLLGEEKCDEEIIGEIFDTYFAESKIIFEELIFGLREKN